MHIKFFIIIISLSAIVRAEASNSAQDVFNQLSKLVGEWEGTYSNGNRHHVSYRLTSNGTVLVENWTMSATRESMTLYMVEAEQLLALHFCPRGNQPTLAFVGKDIDDKFHFEFIDGRNLHYPDGKHQHAFWLRFEEHGSFARSETYIVSSLSDLSGMLEGESVIYHRISKSKQ